MKKAFFEMDLLPRNNHIDTESSDVFKISLLLDSTLYLYIMEEAMFFNLEQAKTFINDKLVSIDGKGIKDIVIKKYTNSKKLVFEAFRDIDKYNRLNMLDTLVVHNLSWVMLALEHFVRRHKTTMIALFNGDENSVFAYTIFSKDEGGMELPQHEWKHVMQIPVKYKILDFVEAHYTITETPLPSYHLLPMYKSIMGKDDLSVNMTRGSNYINEYLYSFDVNRPDVSIRQLEILLDVFRIYYMEKKTGVVDKHYELLYNYEQLRREDII